MRLVTYEAGRGLRAGLLRGDEVVDAWDALGGGEPPTVRALLEEPGAPDELRSTSANGLSLTDVSLLPPLPDPDKIVCIGLNYRSHAAEARLEPPTAPTFFAKFRNALAPPDARVALPTGKTDFEAEVAFVVARRCRDVPESEALGYVAGYMLFNDLSARDRQFATPQWMPGKVFDGSAPCGPALVTPDEAGPHDGIEFALRLNGEEMQRASTSDLVFSVPALLSHLSGLMTLEPGDIVATGTPAGVGSVRQPRVWLRPGDEMVVSSPSLGELTTWVVGSS